MPALHAQHHILRGRPTNFLQPRDKLLRVRLALAPPDDEVSVPLSASIDFLRVPFLGQRVGAQCSQVVQRERH